MTLPATYYAVTQRICALNNHGVKSLQAGGTARAEEYFGEAIVLSKELIASSAQHLDEDDFMRYTNQTKECCCSCPACQIRPSTQEEEMDAPIYLYNRTLMLPQRPCHVQTLESSCLNCAVILFNMGLMNHMMGLKNQKIPQALARAEAFYERSILLLNGVPRLAAQRNETAILIITATGNNLAQIALENGNIAVVRNRLKFLNAILRGPNETLHSVLTTVEWTGILSNVLLRNGLNAARAA
ncbi:unnamed protein product [Cylindrotheca closterium]|uniref:Uncharacterized protein n=1 Tax=Cylindrotheca closterium TaxID=2856 RepID=A0AAD2CKL8_9STRA|nr:unnamed protein product [Cylindrotheca closterium]